jgi:hypothetical protein
MSQSQRQRRLRLLVKKLNKERKRQASQIDILCNDLIAAHRSFVHRLNGVSFAASFFKNLLGESDLRRLLLRAGQLLEKEMPGANITFFLRQPEGCRIPTFESHEALLIDNRPLEDLFQATLVDCVCKANRPCTLDDLVDMGLEGNLADLNEVSMATLPLNDLGRALGFVLVYRPVPCRLRTDELRKASLITCGLSHAIAGCRLPLHCGG